MTDRSAPAFPPVRSTPDSEDFFAAAAEGWLLLRECVPCGAVRGPQVRWCPRCGSEQHRALRASGDARVVSWAVVHRAPLPQLEGHAPYVAGLVELAEGPWLLVRIVTGPEEELQPGLAVTLTSIPASDESEALMMAATPDVRAGSR